MKPLKLQRVFMFLNFKHHDNNWQKKQINFHIVHVQGHAENTTLKFI